MKTKKDKIVVIGLIVLLICILCVALMFCGKKEPANTEEKDPHDNVVQTHEQDVDVSDYEEYDWEENAFETQKDDKKFNQNKQSSDKDTTTETDNKKNDNQLRHDETMNSGIEVEFDSWDSQ